MAKHIVKFWRGRRTSYNFLANNNALDSWTRYVVIEPNGEMTEYYGANQISTKSGQLLPVKSVVPSMSGIEPEPGERYLVGSDGEGYEIYEYSANSDGTLSAEIHQFDERYGVRVKDRALKNYIYVEGELKTYDDVDCGLF